MKRCGPSALPAREVKRMTIQIENTSRGFACGEFTDQYGEACSIQKSSLATDDCIWLGINDVQPKTLIKGEGWKDIELPTDALCSGRMHLTREMAADLIPLLQKFVETGELG